jgi:predicted DNA-binding transcriptional regulator AlpA
MRPENFVSKKEVARLFGGVSTATIARWVQDGKLPKPTRRFLVQRWRYEELMQWLHARRSEKQF